MKTLFLKMAIALIFLVVFNVLFFLLCGSDNSTSVWISYGFIHVAYLILLITPLFLVKTETAPVLNYTIWLLNIIYFIVELIVGTGFIIYAVKASNDSIIWPLLVQSIILAVFLFILFANMLANDVTQKNEEQRIVETDNFDATVDELRALGEEPFDSEIKIIIGKCYSELRYGPVRSHPSVAVLENDIRSNIILLQDAIFDNDKDTHARIARTLLHKIQERNRKLKNIH